MRRATRLCALILGASTIGWASSQPCFSAEASGITVAVVQSAAASGQTGTRVLQSQGLVYMGDQVKTGSVGEAQIRFVDETRLVVGPNSSLLIDSFVFDAGSKTAKEVSMRAVEGAFRFISGVSQKQAYKISTPTMTLGIRGTKFDFTVRRDGETIFALYEGAARVCDRSNRCVELSGRCAVAVSPRRNRVRHVESFQERAAMLRTSLPYAFSQTRLRPDFRIDTSSCTMTRAALEPTPQVRSAALSPTLQPPPPPPVRGNPGNNKAVGRAGESPNGRYFGPGTRGRSDARMDVSVNSTGSGNGNAGANGNGGGNGNGNGHGNGNGNGHGNGHGNGNGNGGGGGGGGGHGR